MSRSKTRVKGSKGAIVPKSLDELVRRRVDEILAQRDAQLFEPDFQPKPIHTEAMRRLNLFDKRKWALYFGKWGCRGCQTKTAPHVGQGYCQPCYYRVLNRLTALKRVWDAAHARYAPTSLGETIRTAKRVFASETARLEEE